SNLLHRPFFFLFLLRPPPISTLFPYTTLFLSLLDAVAPVISLVATRGFRDIRIVVVSFSVTVLVESVCVSATTLISMAGHNAPRSEEHTSELQSLTNLVCRLLLEKKKQILNLH